MDIGKKIYLRNYNVLRKVYIFIYILLVMQRAWGPFKAITPFKLDALIFLGITTLGVVLIFYDLFSDKILFKTQNVSWLCIFLISVFISSILNINYGIMSNINSMILLSIEFFIFYAVDFNRSKIDVYKEIYQIEHFIMIVWFLSMLVTLWMFLEQSYYYIDLPENQFVRMGIIENRLFGIYNDPNYASITSLIMIVFSVKNFKKDTNRFLKIFYTVNIFFMFIYIILSGSRTAEVALGITVLVGAFFIFRCSFKNMSKVKKVLLSILCSVLSLVCIFIVYFLLKKGIAYLPSLFEGNDAGNTIRPVSFSRSDVEENSDISNLRFKIWGSALEVFRSKPIFGVSVKHIVAYARDNFPEGIIAVRGYTGHSFYVNVIACTGIVGSILIFGFIIKSIITTLKAIFTVTDKEQYFDILFSCLPLIILLCSGFFLNEIIFVNTLGSIIFWIYLGYTMYFVNGEKPYTETSIPYRIADKLTSKIKSVFHKNK